MAAVGWQLGDQEVLLALHLQQQQRRAVLDGTQADSQEAHGEKKRKLRTHQAAATAKKVIVLGRTFHVLLGCSITSNALYKRKSSAIKTLVWNTENVIIFKKKKKKE